MLNALDINTKEIIASSSDRAALIRAASEKVGREGFCIRAAVEGEGNDRLEEVVHGVLRLQRDLWVSAETG